MKPNYGRRPPAAPVSPAFRGIVAAAVLLLAGHGAVAAPRVWVEAAVEPATVPVNAQATYVLRFGHAVDVRAPRFEPPRPRLAEVVALGPEVQSEVVREGLRYRVHERRFAVLPFASGVLSLDAAVSGTTPATLAETGGRASFVLAAPLLRLDVRPAVDGKPWLPAMNVQNFLSNATSPTLRVGEVWTRQLLIEADGVDGSVITPPAWPASADWSVQLDPPEVGRRIEGGRLIGYRRQTIHAQALRAGRLSFPAVAIAWWQLPAGPWRLSQPAAASVEVVAVGSAAGATHAAPVPSTLAGSTSPPPADESGAPPGRPDRRPGEELPSLAQLAIAALLLLGLRALWRWPAARRARGTFAQRRQSARALAAATRAGAAPAAQRALLAWVAAGGLRVRSLGALIDALAALPAASEPQRGRLIAALEQLEAACYGATAPGWDGHPLRQALRALKRGRHGLALAGFRLSSPPVR